MKEKETQLWDRDTELAAEVGGGGDFQREVMVS